jgi:serine/threonine-protein kinase
MPLSVGDKLGHYEVISLLGNGGMGEVYRARDTTLKRDVALKVLPATFLGDPDRMARFQREAQVLASLDHPNIGPIYGIADSEDSRGLVLALIEGPTLADRIETGPVPLDEAVAISKQIIEALEYAHDRGVVHRDLKPANVKVTPDGIVKVLDFGLAKVLEDEPPASSLTNSPTLTVGHTRAGVILGTAAYMSPEQAVGRPVDRRSDIFSFGAVLYEMLTGTRAFTGAATPDVLEAVVKSDPDWSKLPAETPGYLRKLLERTLVKDRKQRLQAIGEARIMLENPVEQATLSPAHSAPAWPWIAAAVLGVTTVVALWAPWRSQKPVDRPLVRLDVDLGSDVALFPVNTPTPTLTVAISPDGTRLVYLATVSGGQPRLFTRRLDQPKATELPGTAGAVGPFFSPDGNWVGFSVGSKVSKVSVDGGSVVPLADAPPTIGASWGEDGNIILGGGLGGSGLQRIPSGGGSRADALPLASGELFQVVPQILPGGKAVLFIANSSLDSSTAHVDVVTLADGRRKTIVKGMTALYLPTSSGSGHLVYTNNGTLFAVPFDPERLETRGTAVQILDDIAYHTATGTAQFDVSRSGTLVYRRGGGATASGMMTLQWVDANGRKEPLRVKPGDYSNPSISPDGKQIAMVNRGSNDVWVYDTQRDAMRRLTVGGGPYVHPVWSPDGKYVFAGSLGNGVFWTRSDGAGQPQPLTQAKMVHAPWSLTPDGKRLGYLDPSSGAPQLWTVPLEENGGQLKAGKPEQFLKSQFQDVGPAFSPDGKWLAYSSNAAGSSEVFVRAFPPPASGQGGQWQVSNSGGTSPVWSRNGHDLLYQSVDQLMAVGYTVKGDTFVAEKPRVWLAKLGGTEWDLAPDGKRVVVLTAVNTPEASKPDHDVVFVFNFFDELRRRAPADK